MKLPFKLSVKLGLTHKTPFAPDFTSILMSLRFPDQHQARTALLISGAVFICVTAIYFLHLRIPFSVQGWAALILGIAISVTSCQLYRWNPLYMLLMLFLALPPLYSGLMVLLGINEGIFCSFGQTYQTPMVTAKVMLLTVIALSVSSIGWGLAVVKKPLSEPVKPILGFNYRFAFYAVIAVFAGTQTAILYGDFIWNASYASNLGTPLLGINMFPGLAVIGILGMFTMLLFSAQRTFMHYMIFLIISSYVLLFCMFFRGSRLEVVVAGIGIYFLWLDTRQKKVPVARLFICGVALFLFLQIWGVFRQTLYLSDISTLAKLRSSISFALKKKVVLSKNKYQPNDYPMSTVGDIASTFYMTVGLVDKKALPMLYGRSYLEYIPRTLPKFIYPNRPADLAWVFPSAGERSGGGFFALGEAYMNFGVFGCVVIPFIFSFLLGKVSIKCISSGRVVWFFFHIYVMSVLLRGMWHGNFTLYKSLFTWMLIEMFISAAMIWKKRTFTKKAVKLSS